MAQNIMRRIEAVEARTGGGEAKLIFKWKPSGMDDQAYAVWHAAEIEPHEKAGADITIYSFLVWPPCNTDDLRGLLRSSNVATSPADLAVKIRALPPYPEQAAMLAELALH